MGSIWFTDPPFGLLGYYEGYLAKQGTADETSTASTARAAKLTVVEGGVARPNGLLLFAGRIDRCIWSSRALRRATFTAYDVAGAGRYPTSASSSTWGPGTPDGMRCDVDGNLWMGWGMGDATLDGVNILQRGMAN